MRKVEVVDHNPQWAQDYAVEEQLIKDALGDTITAIHHIGSTSVSDLAAKPVIDIMLEVTSLDELDSKNAALEALGYVARGENGIERRRYFEKGGMDRTHQIHAFPTGDEHVTRHIAFRDYLRAHPEVAREYEAVKRRAAQIANHDIEIYCDEKDAFIVKYEALALDWMHGML
ncbi:GrpB family protein [Rhodobacteraceae bacterium RKSG542]|uniref:GrpB family protein n=1 Tax=Pseudovibrio flavus TaxID=2529854 RepID=UPI003529778B|nr:GrpB family protein [Pseudovibrio flavus]